MTSIETTLVNFLHDLEIAGALRFQHNSEIVKFWQDSFNQYIGKMKQPKNIDKNPRRYFHLHAMKYVLAQSTPDIVWNLCVGNIKTNMPVLLKFLESSKEKKSKSYWINIDFVPELKSFNENFLLKYFSLARNSLSEDISYIECENTFIFNITGYVEDFFGFFNNEKYPFTGKKQTILCLDGISNVTVHPNDWIGWWTGVKNILASHFTSWYFTFLHPASLAKKFDFYHDVVLLKHKIPLNWLETSVIDFFIKESDTLQFKERSKSFYKLQKNTLSKIVSEEEITTTDLLFRFFSDVEKTTLVYQALYITEPTLKLLSKIGLVEYVGHKEIDQLIFDLPDDFYENTDQNFVKSIPYIGLQD